MMKRAKTYLLDFTSIAPLTTFRVLFGFLMALSLLRFSLRGWITDLYVAPSYYFTFLGFDWVQPLGDVGTHLLFLVAFLAAIGIMLGWFYRVAAILFFCAFTYIELIDKTNYLNHYYFVSLISFLLIFVPAHRSFSLDVIRKPTRKFSEVPRWTILIFKAQLVIVYFFAGLAKLNYDWLINAMPMKLWLPTLTHLPILGPIFNYEWTAYLFSWGGAFYDLTIALFLILPWTRKWAFATVVLFHLMTAYLFQIGMFPYIMICCTLIFFSGNFHEQIQLKFSQILHLKVRPVFPYKIAGTPGSILPLLSLFFFLQLVVPIRHLAYPGSLFWTEQGYRFSWRVMLMEKAGYAQFTVRDSVGDKLEWVNNYEYLTPQQEKMMSTQPDMILQFAHFLAKAYEQKGFEKPGVYCDSRVTLNGRRSAPLIDSNVNLAAEKRNIWEKKWILPQT